MEEKVQMVIMEFQDSMRPGNAHWFAFPMPPGMSQEGFELQGHKVVTLGKAAGETLRLKCRDAMALQLELRELFYKTEMKIKGATNG